MKERPVIVGLGEVLWDMFPDGARFGGAPANFACHAAGLGARAYMVSAVGKDELGDRAVESLQTLGVDTSCVGRDDRRPTGTVRIELDATGQPQYEIAANTAWDHLEWSPALEQLGARCDAVCFGTLGQRSDVSRHTIRRFVESTRQESLRVLDVNLRQDFYDSDCIHRSLRQANLLKLNDDELAIVASMCGVTGTGAATLKELARRFELRLVALTRGEKGAMLLTENEVTECSAIDVTVQDTVGAGDAFTAALVLGLLRDRPLAEINRSACKIAAFVCSQSGATPKLPSEIKRMT